MSWIDQSINQFIYLFVATWIKYNVNKLKRKEYVQSEVQCSYQLGSEREAI